jgi:tetratricopeptide (TPR) repeat protein
MNVRQSHAKSVFLNAVDLATPAERRAYLDEECGDDESLRGEVEDLLRHFGQVGTFLESTPDLGATALERPIGEGAGTVIGPYKLLEPIGEGGFGMVFLAEQAQPVRRQVALKVLKPGMDTRQVVARFEAERQALALMDHPHIAKVLDGGTTESGRPFFVMELVRGTPITDFCDQNRLPVRRRLELFVLVCQAVQHAHLKGVIHRDLKPSNVLVTAHDGAAAAKVIDFGIAKAIGQRLTDKTLHTSAAQMIGTPLYMSPEQAGFSGLDVDTRADIYALGALLYELLTGTTPFESGRLRAADCDAVRRIIREEEPPRPSARVSTLGPEAATVSLRRQSDPKRLGQLFHGELDWIVMKALERDRNRRYETAGAFAADVQRYLCDEPVAAGPPSAWYRLRKFVRRRRRALAMTAVVAAALALAGGAALWSERRQAALAAAQQAREEALDNEVSRTADEAEALVEEGKWPEAAAAVERGEKLLAAAGRTERPERLRELREDLAMTRRLEEVYSRPRVAEDFLGPALDDEYARAFREYGIDVAALPVEEVAERIRSRSIRLELARALDFWSRARRAGGAAGWQSLLDLAKAVDPDPWRNQLRDALKADDRKGVQAVALSAGARRLPPRTLQLLGEAILVEAGTMEEAAALLRAAQRQYPDDHVLNTIVGWLCFNARPPQYGEAVRYFTAALAVRPHNPYIARNLGWALLMNGSAAEAVADFSRAIDLKPDFLDAWFGRGEAYRRLGDRDRARADFARAVQLEPLSVSDFANRGRAHTTLGEFDRALADDCKAIELDPTRAEAWCNRAVVYANLKRWDESLADCCRAIELDPRLALAWVNRAIAYAHLGQGEKALADCCKAIELEPKLAAAWHVRGGLYAAAGQWDKAVADYSRLIELGPRDALARTNRGCAYAGLRQWDKALADHSRAIELDPKLALAWYNRAAARAQLRQWDKVLADCSQAVELDPKLAMAWANRGGAHAALGQWDKALADSSKAIEVNPKLVLAWTNRGLAFTNLGRWDKAAADYARAVELAPKEKAYWSALGQVRYRATDYKAAVSALDKAMELEKGGNAFDWLYLAMARWKLGDEAKARDWYHRAARRAEEKDQANNARLKALRAEAEKLIAKPK